MKLNELVFENSMNFDEEFLRAVAKDQGVDLSSHSREQLIQIHQHILDQAMEYLDDPDMGLSYDDIGQEYYDVAKQYFGN